MRGIASSALVVAALVAGCGQAVPDEKPSGELVVGVRPQAALAGYVNTFRVRVTTSASAAPTVQDFSAISDASNGGLAPFTLSAGAMPAGQIVAVTVEGYREALPLAATSTPVVVTSAHAPVVAGDPRLVRLVPEGVCTAWGDLAPLACPQSQTCSQARCIDDTVMPEDLLDPHGDWARENADPCRSDPEASPSLEIGTGQSDYLPVSDGTTLQLERGPQGGHHLWVALRLWQTHQSGAVVTLTATVPGTDIEVPPTRFSFALSPGEGGSCKLSGLRYQLDNGTAKLEAFLGQPLDLRVHVDDPSGRSADAVRHLVIDSTVR